MSAPPLSLESGQPLARQVSGTRFHIHGLTVESEFPLMAASAAPDAPPHVRIAATAGRHPFGTPIHENGYLSTFRDNVRGAWGLCWRFGRQRYGFWSDPTRATIDVHLSASARPYRVSNILEGPVLATWLREVGTLCLHACSVVVGERVALIAGGSGSGKSTTTGALVADGCPMLSEDVVTLDDALDVQAGSARLRLSVEAAQRLGWDARRLPVLARHVPRDPRVFVDLRAYQRFLPRALPLGAVFILTERTGEMAFTRLGQGESMRALAHVVYHAPTVGVDHRATLVRQLLTLARRVPVYAVAAPPLDALGRFARAIMSRAVDAL